MTKYNPQYRALDDLERFDVLQAMFPGEIGDSDEDWDRMEDTIAEKFDDMSIEAFDELVGRLVMLAPVMSSPLTNTSHHVLGRIEIAGGKQLMTATVKREAVFEQETAS